MFLFKLNQNVVQLTPGHFRSIFTSIINFESNLSLLRKRTGLTFTLCKKALEANNNDLKLAEEWLKEEVKRTGLAKSQKMNFRVANEGLVGVYVDKLKKSGVILEVNCETDFVAKNIKFKELVSKLTKDFATVPQVEESPVKNSIQKYVLNQERMPKGNEHISEAITHLGEKIEIKKACFIKNHYDDPSISLIGYAHSTEGLNNYLDDVTFGKYGTIVALRQLPEPAISETESKDNMDELDSADELLDFPTAAKQICQHIIVAAPDRVRSDPVDAIVRDEIVPDEIVQDVQNECDQETATNVREEQNKQTSVLVDQEFLHSDYETVNDFLNLNNLEVIDFVRVKCGEE